MENRLQRLKELYDNGVLNNSIVFMEFKPQILKWMKKGYKNKYIIPSINNELKKVGIDFEVKPRTFIWWKKQKNRITGKPNITKEEIQNAVIDDEVTTGTSRSGAVKTKTGIFDNLKKIN